jgi:hypothetical protein
MGDHLDTVGRLRDTPATTGRAIVMTNTDPAEAEKRLQEAEDALRGAESL